MRTNDTEKAEMSSEAIATGKVLGIGGTRARKATYNNGAIEDFTSEPTSQDADGFFRWLGREVVDAEEAGNAWVVAGFPGLVSPDGQRIGPMNNVPGLAKAEYTLRDRLIAVDPAVKRALAKIGLFAVTDGELAAHAAASKSSNPDQTTWAALIAGTGVGAGIVRKHGSVIRPARVPLELGHVPRGRNPRRTPENEISGPALARTYWCSPEQLPKWHWAWPKVATGVAELVMMLGLVEGVDEVMMCGGVGAGAADKYMGHLQKRLERYRRDGNEVQRNSIPRVTAVSPEEVQFFEMFGAGGVALDFTTRDTARELAI